MSECKELQILAEKLSEKASIIRAKQTEDSIQEIMLSQALYGIQLSVGHTLGQIKQAIEIEEVDGNN